MGMQPYSTDIRCIYVDQCKQSRPDALQKPRPDRLSHRWAFRSYCIRLAERIPLNRDNVPSPPFLPSSSRHQWVHRFHSYKPRHRYCNQYNSLSQSAWRIALFYLSWYYYFISLSYWSGSVFSFFSPSSSLIFILSYQVLIPFMIPFRDLYPTKMYVPMIRKMTSPPPI